MGTETGSLPVLGQRLAKHKHIKRAHLPLPCHATAGWLFWFFPLPLDARGEGSAQVLGEICEERKRLGRGGLEDVFYLTGDCLPPGLVVAEHTEVAGELVRYGLGFGAGGFVECAG